MINKIIQWVLDNKVVTILSVLLFSFFIATIAVAVEKSNALDKLKVCEDSLNTSTSTTQCPTTTLAISTPTPGPSENTSYRLSPDVIPHHYNITLHPNMEESTFECEVKIKIEIKKSRTTVELHSYLLNIKEVFLKKSNNDIKSTFYSMEGDDEILVIKPDTQLPEGEYEIHIKYNANMTGINIGFYMSTLNDGKKIATSKFEPTYARQAFPCFDEPAMKAQYTVNIVRPTTDFSLSNMDLASTAAYGDSFEIDTYNTSVPMSTYLACFIICQFENKTVTINTDEIGEDFNFTVYATKEQINKVNFSIDIGKSVTEYYIKYFEIEYPLPKLDMIAIPDFVSGAMEHWGLVTYRETNLLYDEKTTSTANKQNIARVVAHEISHMWFGNLVTMKWWDELWLNEGFASYMQYKALDKIHSEWKTLEQFNSANTHSVMDLDATLASHPIVVKVETPDEITAIFDSISYNKGAAVLRMLENIVGEEEFRKGVKTYLEKYKYNNTITQNFLDILAKPFEDTNTELNLTHIMDTWTRQMGLPLVTVKKINDTTYSLKQERFLADPDVKPESPSMFNDKWFIPITYTTTNGVKDKILWFPDGQDEIFLKLEDGDMLLKLNNNQSGYYRVNYDAESWEKILLNLAVFNESTLNTSDRGNILNDAFSLAEAGALNYSKALEISKYLKNETDYLPWSVASSELSSLKRRMSNSIKYIEFTDYVQSILEGAYDIFTWERNDTDHVTNLTRGVVLNLACSFGHEDCLKNASERFKQWLDDVTVPLNPDLKGIIYYYGIEAAGDKTWDKVWDIFVKEEDAQEKAKLMQALAASRNPFILQRYLNLAWNTSYIRTQDYFTVLRYISSNPVGTPLVWDYVRGNWHMIVERYTLNSRVLGTTIPAITNSFATQQRLDEMEKFFEVNHEAGAGASGRKQAIENVKNNIKWLEKYEKSVSNWLEEEASSRR